MLEFPERQGTAIPEPQWVLEADQDTNEDVEGNLHAKAEPRPCAVSGRLTQSPESARAAAKVRPRLSAETPGRL